MRRKPYRQSRSRQWVGPGKVSHWSESAEYFVGLEPELYQDLEKLRRSVQRQYED